MADELTLTAPEAATPITKWKVSGLYVDVDEASIQVTLKANTGARYVWSSPLTPAALVFINEGRWTLTGKTFQRWLLEQIAASGAKVGTVA
jgi:hypothetical protein